MYDNGNQVSQNCVVYIAELAGYITYLKVLLEQKYVFKQLKHISLSSFAVIPGFRKSGRRTISANSIQRNDWVRKMSVNLICEFSKLILHFCSKIKELFHSNCIYPIFNDTSGS